MIRRSNATLHLLSGTTVQGAQEHVGQGSDAITADDSRVLPVQAREAADRLTGDAAARAASPRRQRRRRPPG